MVLNRSTETINKNQIDIIHNTVIFKLSLDRKNIREESNLAYIVNNAKHAQLMTTLIFEYVYPPMM